MRPTRYIYKWYHTHNLYKYQTILISRIILGFGMGLFNGHSANYISHLFEREKASFLHRMRSSMEYISQMTLLLIAGFFIKIKWPLAFLCYTCSIFVFLFFSKYVEDIRPEERRGDFLSTNKQSSTSSLQGL